MVEQRSRVIEVFADVGCPFTHVGLRRLVEERTARGLDHDVRLHVRGWPLEDVNAAPLAPSLIAREVDELRQAVAADLFVGFDPHAFPSTSKPAFALAASAYRRDVETGEAVSMALRTLLFECGEDVSDPSVLARVEREHGLQVTTDDVASIDVDHREGIARGVIGSPHFFTPTGSFFCPALDITKDDVGHLQITFDQRRFDEFVASVFGPTT